MKKERSHRNRHGDEPLGGRFIEETAKKTFSL